MRKSLCSENGPHPGFDIRMASERIGVDDIGVTKVHNSHAFEIGDVILMIIRTAMPEAEKSRCLANRTRTKACSSPPLRPKIKGSAENRDIRFDIVPIRLIG